MAFITGGAYDAALNLIATDATTLYICSAEPSDFAGIAAVELGSKSNPTFTGPVAGDVSGRKLTVDAITSGGGVTATGSATHFAIASGSELLVAGSLSAPASVSSGDLFTLTAFDITIPAAV